MKLFAEVNDVPSRLMIEKFKGLKIYKFLSGTDIGTGMELKI